MSFLLPVIGGLGLFIYGMNVMAEGLQKSAGNKLRTIVEKLTTNRFKGVLVGAVVTMLIQSSSATTVMVIGFVNAGIMTLAQAVGVIMGANVGTTVTGQLIALNLTDYAPIAIAIGVFMKSIGKKKKTKNLAEVLIGFGILFVGLGSMSGGLKPLANSPVFAEVLTKLSNPFLAMLTGAIMTTLVQSSSAAIGILQALASQNLIGINIAFPILFGDNIGTTTTAMISSVGANTTAKRAALLHLVFNTVGTLIFMTVLRWPIEKLVLLITPDNPMKQIANAHTLFNLINVAIQLPFANYLVKLVETLIPGDTEEDGKVSKYLDSRFLEAPSIAVNQVKKEVIHMGEMALQNLNDVKELMFSGDQELLEKVLDKEQDINQVNREITQFIVKLGNESLSNAEKERLNMFMYIINDIERIGDHVENIAEFTTTQDGNVVKFTEAGSRDASAIFNGTIRIMQMAMTAFESVDYNLATDVIALEEDIDQMEKRFRDEHMHRLNEGTCSIDSGLVFLDTMSNLERIADHSYNIARYVEDIHKGKIQEVTPENF